MYVYVCELQKIKRTITTFDNALEELYIEKLKLEAGPFLISLRSVLPDQ